MNGQFYLRLKALPVWLKAAIIIIFAALIAWIVIPAGAPNLPKARVSSGEFVIDLKETGRLRAENSVTVSAPPVRTNLQIIDLVPEGTVVKEGDFLVQFDTTELKQVIDDRNAELDIARSNLARSMASIESQMANRQSSVENSEASYRLAQLRLDQMKFEADKRIEEGKLSLRQAEISLEQARQQVAAQRLIDSAEVRSLQLKIKQAEIEVNKSLSDLAKLRLIAPANGLVIYKEIWKGGETGKIKVGDTPWRGQALIELPDLSVMLVETAVSEVDISKVKVGQEVEVRLDAYPEPTFHGEVIDIAALASTDEGVSEAKVFKINVRIKESNPLLKPGMTASARIIVDRIPDKMWVPIESVFERDGEKIVWIKSGSGFKARPVKISKRNDNFVIIEEGLEVSDVVALIDPSIAAEEPTKSKTKQEIKGESTPAKAANEQPSRSGRQTRVSREGR